jgi:hypothetical protein
MYLSPLVSPPLVAAVSTIGGVDCDDDDDHDHDHDH